MLPFAATVGHARVVRAGAVCVFTLLAAAGCGPSGGTGFSLERAGKHVRMLATAIGSRPTGSQANARARDYVADRLREAGFEVRLQEAVASSPSGLTTPVVNIIGLRQGRQPEAVALVSHYDSPPESRGAADDGLGVAVCLESARVLAGRPDPRYTLLVAVTDGEELGLMGARALRETPEFARVRAFLNFEAVGTSGPARLFQAGPGNSWLPKVWAAAAQSPSGSSLFTEVYRRLPNDTDFTVLVESGPPGLNFALTGNTFAYHTSLDTPARLESATMQRLGDTTIRLVEALDLADIGQRTPDDATYFDAAGLAAMAYSGGATRIFAVFAFVLGLLATCKALLAARAEVGVLRLAVTAVWALVGGGALLGVPSMAVYLLRLGTGLEHPWYAQAHVFAVFLAAVGLGGLWIVNLLGRRLPVMIGPSGHPACVWTLTLPVWAGVLAFLQRTAPGVGYLFAFPLLTASILVLALPVREAWAGRVVSAVAAVVAGMLWAPLAWPLFEFAVGLFGAMPASAPVWLFPALSVAMVCTVGPSLAGLLLGRPERLIPAGAVSSVLLLAVVGSAWIIAVEPAYTAERPERRRLHYLQDMVQQKAIWEAGTRERTLAPVGSDPSAPGGWSANGEAPAAPVSRVGGLFRYQARATGLVAPPLEVRATTQQADGVSNVWLETTAVPRLEGTGVAFILPPGVTPAESNLHGVVRDGRWRATVRPAPASGVTLRVRLSLDDLAQLPEARVVAIVHGVPGGVGWQRLPPWLTRESVVWVADSSFILPWPVPVTPPALEAEPRQGVTPGSG